LAVLKFSQKPGNRRFQNPSTKINGVDDAFPSAYLPWQRFNRDGFLTTTMRKIFWANFTALASGLLLAGCFAVEKPGMTEPEAAEPTGTGLKTPFEINQGSHGVPKTGYLYGTPIHYEEINGEAIFQSDIILSKEQMTAPGLAKETGAAKPSSFERWPGNIVPWDRANGLSRATSSWIDAAIADIASKTHVHFVQHTTEKDYILFTPDPSACSSPVGRQGLMQPIQLAPTCDQGSITHEIFHALGMWHEQSRADRNLYINVNYDNIDYTDKGDPVVYRMNWDQYSFNAGFDHGAFDFSSIMLYASYAASKLNGPPVMTRLDGTAWDATHVPSAGDLSTINGMYPSTTTRNSTMKFRDIGAGRNGTVYAVSTSLYGTSTTDYKLYKWAKSLVGVYQWTSVSGAGGVRLDVDPSGHPWVVQASGRVKYYNGSSWATLSDVIQSSTSHLTKVKDIGIGGDGRVYVLSAGKLDADGKNYTVWTWTGSDWSQVKPTSGVGGKGIRISADDQGNPWTLTNIGEILCTTGGQWHSMYFPYGMGTGGGDIGVAGDGTVYIVSGEYSIVNGKTDYHLYQKSGPANSTLDDANVFFTVGSIMGANVDAVRTRQAWILGSDNVVKTVNQ
jgi:hypothetical protein